MLGTQSALSQLHRAIRKHDIAHQEVRLLEASAFIAVELK
jgi:hypothetical protein